MFITHRSVTIYPDALLRYCCHGDTQAFATFYSRDMFISASVLKKLFFTLIYVLHLFITFCIALWLFQIIPLYPFETMARFLQMLNIVMFYMTISKAFPIN